MTCNYQRAGAEAAGAAKATTARLDTGLRGEKSAATGLGGLATARAGAAAPEVRAAKNERGPRGLRGVRPVVGAVGAARLGEAQAKARDEAPGLTARRKAAAASKWGSASAIVGSPAEATRGSVTRGWVRGSEGMRGWV